jgi:cytochrome oxidase assembly protein ShyY1
MQTAPVREAAPPATEVTVHGALVPDEGDGSDTPDADGIVRDLDVRGIASSLPYDVFPLPLQLAGQTPPQPGALPIPVPLPALSEGPHLSYAIQWFSFATIALVGAAILLRRDRRALTGAP